MTIQTTPELEARLKKKKAEQAAETMGRKPLRQIGMIVCVVCHVRGTTMVKLPNTDLYRCRKSCKPCQKRCPVCKMVERINREEHENSIASNSTVIDDGLLSSLKEAGPGDVADV